jgi:hypothetical protein
MKKPLINLTYIKNFVLLKATPQMRAENSILKEPLALGVSNNASSLEINAE